MIESRSTHAIAKRVEQEQIVWNHTEELYEKESTRDAGWCGSHFSAPTRRCFPELTDISSNKGFLKKVPICDSTALFPENTLSAAHLSCLYTSDSCFFITSMVAKLYPFTINTSSSKVPRCQTDVTA